MITPETSPSGAQPEKSKTQVPSPNALQRDILAALRVAGITAHPGVSPVELSGMLNANYMAPKDPVPESGQQEQNPTKPVDD